MSMLLSTLLVLSALLIPLGGGSVVSISNVLPRRNSTGSLIDVHDGTILLINSTYFYWGMTYGLCNITKSGCDGLWYPPHCGYKENHNLSLYTSPDLVTWAFALDALPMATRPAAVYYRPQIVYNANTRMFVLWVNAVQFWPGSQDPNYFNATYVVATTPDPLTPFMVVGAAETSMGSLGVGDVSLFIDPKDSAGYVAYSAWAAGGHAVSIDRLTPDYLNSTRVSSGVITPPFYEAPLLFTRGGAYFLLTGPTCCFCAEGAASKLFVATTGSALGPWVDTGSFVDPPGANNVSMLGAQNSMLVEVDLAGKGGSGGGGGGGGGGSSSSKGMVWVGDRWASAVDGLFGHNLQYWGLVQWDDSVFPPRLVAPLQWQDTLSLDLANLAAS